ncbi:MAG: VWA domain-containing protein [Acidiferrobacterales bacterium]|nr:VWA domain-containing protein [Acidiferrobacterales bacterium]
MLSWQWPWIFILLPIPLLLRWWLPSGETAPQAIRVPFFEQLRDLHEQTDRSTVRVWLNILLAIIVWLALLCAAARPTWVGEPIPIPQDRRDLMLAVDISRSMEESDMRVSGGYASRIDAVKYVVGEFVEQRAGDRIGLILFGEQAYLQTPLTFDTRTVNEQLNEAQLGFAGNATAIGDAIGLAIKRLRDRPAESRVLILLTDGANTAGTDPNEAMKIADEANIRIHTIGIGAPRRGRPSADIDERLLSNIATRTGGEYFRARDPSELQRIYAELDRLEPMPEEQIFRPTISLSYWPLALALLGSALLALIRILSSGSFFGPKSGGSEIVS